MKAIVQRVTSSQLIINQEVYAEIGQGIMLLIGIEASDTEMVIDKMIYKIVNLRIFNDDRHKMNLSLQDIQGEIMIVSQFTLLADTSRGHRPSYMQAASPDIAVPIYNSFVGKMKHILGAKVQTGVFGADMKVQLVNDGPVTISLTA